MSALAASAASTAATPTASSGSGIAKRPEFRDVRERASGATLNAALRNYGP